MAIQVHGGNGFAAEYGIAGLWWMARVLRTAPVSREMILNYVAEHSCTPTPVVLAAPAGDRLAPQRTPHLRRGLATRGRASFPAPRCRCRV